MIIEKKDCGYYCTICKTTYSDFGNIEEECLTETCGQSLVESRFQELVDLLNEAELTQTNYLYLKNCIEQC